MKIIIFLTIGIVAWFAFLRPWLRNKPWMQWFFLWPPIEWFELHVYRKAESIGLARYFTGLGVVLTTISTIDPSSIQMFAPLLPASWRPYVTMLPMVLSAAGLIGEWMRRDISKPVEMVAIPSTAPAEVKQTAAVAEATTKAAVAEIKSAEAEGKI